MNQIKNIYVVRRAKTEDTKDLAAVERSAFPTLFPPTSFDSELKKIRTEYLVVTRDWTQEELERDIDPMPTVDNIVDISGLVLWIKSALLLIPIWLVGRKKKSRSGKNCTGLVGLWYVHDEAHIVMIGLSPGERRKGVGELLLISALKKARHKGSRIVTLEVRRSNEVARKLYRKYAFREVGIRKKYYADNNEDAVIMTTPPIQKKPYETKLINLINDHERRWGVADTRFI